MLETFAFAITTDGLLFVVLVLALIALVLFILGRR